MVIPCVALHLNLHPLFIVTLDTLHSHHRKKSTVRGKKIKTSYRQGTILFFSNSSVICSDFVDSTRSLRSERNIVHKSAGSGPMRSLPPPEDNGQCMVWANRRAPLHNGGGTSASICDDRGMRMWLKKHSFLCFDHLTHPSVLTSLISLCGWLLCE